MQNLNIIQNQQSKKQKPRLVQSQKTGDGEIMNLDGKRKPQQGRGCEIAL